LKPEPPHHRHARAQKALLLHQNNFSMLYSTAAVRLSPIRHATMLRLASADAYLLRQCGDHPPICDAKWAARKKNDRSMGPIFVTQKNKAALDFLLVLSVLRGPASVRMERC
jgi:hypothetical protein